MSTGRHFSIHGPLGSISTGKIDSIQHFQFILGHLRPNQTLKMDPVEHFWLLVIKTELIISGSGKKNWLDRKFSSHFYWFLIVGFQCHWNLIISWRLKFPSWAEFNLNIPLTAIQRLKSINEQKQRKKRSIRVARNCFVWTFSRLTLQIANWNEIQFNWPWIDISSSVSSTSSASSASSAHQIHFNNI